MKLFWEYNWIYVADIVSLEQFASRGFPTTGPRVFSRVLMHEAASWILLSFDTSSVPLFWMLNVYSEVYTMISVQGIFSWIFINYCSHDFEPCSKVQNFD